MRSKEFKFYVMFLAGIGAVVLAGCGPSDAPNLDLEILEKNPTELAKPTLVEGAQKEDVIQIVKAGAAIDGKGTTEDWVRRQTDAIRGQVMFPQWDVLRRASYKYDVKYVYTLIKEDNEIVKQGYSWTVDMLLKTISAPSELPSEVPIAGQHTPKMTEQKNRIVRERLSLE